jgi:hypothetical protein
MNDSLPAVVNSRKTYAISVFRLKVKMKKPENCLSTFIWMWRYALLTKFKILLTRNSSRSAEIWLKKLLKNWSPRSVALLRSFWQSRTTKSQITLRRQRITSLSVHRRAFPLQRQMLSVRVPLNRCRCLAKKNITFIIIPTWVTSNTVVTKMLTQSALSRLKTITTLAKRTLSSRKSQEKSPRSASSHAIRTSWTRAWTPSRML